MLTFRCFGNASSFELTCSLPSVTAIDYLYDVPSLTWLGTCNELNGAYAADGYARVKGV